MTFSPLSTGVRPPATTAAAGKVFRPTFCPSSETLPATRSIRPTTSLVATRHHLPANHSRCHHNITTATSITSSPPSRVRRVVGSQPRAGCGFTAMGAFGFGKRPTRVRL
ncbi:hypothetical protein Tco_1053092, partial [Tanacetum coccineum]